MIILTKIDNDNSHLKIAWKTLPDFEEMIIDLNSFLLYLHDTALLECWQLK